MKSNVNTCILLCDDILLWRFQMGTKTQGIKKCDVDSYFFGVGYSAT